MRRESKLYRWWYGPLTAPCPSGITVGPGTITVAALKDAITEGLEAFKSAYQPPEIAASDRSGFPLQEPTVKIAGESNYPPTPWTLEGLDAVTEVALNSMSATFTASGAAQVILRISPHGCIISGSADLDGRDTGGRSTQDAIMRVIAHEIDRRVPR